MVKPTPLIGVLALQGAFAKHIEVLQSLGIKAKQIRYPDEFEKCDGLIIPGGESTTIMRHIQNEHFEEALLTFAEKKPIFGTCAGLILMAKEIVGDTMVPFSFLDVAVERNAFGRQTESFRADVKVQLAAARSQIFSAIFIRAPRITKVNASTVKVLAQFENEPILVQQGHHLGATFHPELTADPAIHLYFLNLFK